MQNSVISVVVLLENSIVLLVEATEKRMLVKEGAETEDTEDDAE